jgi:hypothetical protein
MVSQVKHLAAEVIIEIIYLFVSARFVFRSQFARDNWIFFPLEDKIH